MVAELTVEADAPGIESAGNGRCSGGRALDRWRTYAELDRAYTVWRRGPDRPGTFQGLGESRTGEPLEDSSCLWGEPTRRWRTFASDLDRAIDAGRPSGIEVPRPILRIESEAECGQNRRTSQRWSTRKPIGSDGVGSWSFLAGAES